MSGAKFLSFSIKEINMLEYTRAAIEKTIKDLKAIVYFISIAVQVSYIAYLIYAIALDIGFLWANITLVAISASYLVFYLVTLEKKDKFSREAKKTTRHAYNRIKITLNIFTLGMMVYSVYIASTHITTVSVVWVALSAIGLIIKILFELGVTFTENRAELILEGMKADFENVIRPAQTAVNFVKKITGHEVKEEAPPTKIREKLNKLVSIRREKKKAKTEEQKSKKEYLHK